MSSAMKPSSTFSGALSATRTPDADILATVISVLNGVAKVELSSGAVLPRVRIAGSASPGDEVRLRYDAGSGTYIAQGPGGSTGGGGVTLSGGGGGGVVGTLTPSQYPEALLRDGSRQLVGSMSVASGVRIDGVDLSAVNIVAGNGLSGGSFISVDTVNLSVNQAYPFIFTGHVQFRGTVPTAAQGVDRISIGVEDGSPRIVFEDNLFAPWGIDVAGSNLRLFRPLSLRYEFMDGALKIYDSTGITSGQVQMGSGGNMTFAVPGDIVLNPTGTDVLPALNYTVNVGSLTKKYLTFHAAEAWFDTLVAQEKVATIGGYLLVGPTTELTRDLSPSATTIYVKHNQMRPGDVGLFEARWKVEFIEIVSGPVTITEGAEYSYTVTRSIDPTGANDWLQGDAVFNTGTPGTGWLELYAQQSIASMLFDYVFNYNSAGGGSFSQNYAQVTAWPLWDATPGNIAAGDAIYFGMDGGIWSNVFIHITQNLVYSNFGSTFEYWDGSSWTPIVGLSGSDNGLHSTGLINLLWNPSSQTGWSATIVNGVNAYWMRWILQTATVTQSPFAGLRRVSRGQKQWGPTIIGNVRTSTAYNGYSTRFGFGNLDNHYDYGTSTYGFAAGDFAGAWISADATLGFRMMQGSTQKGIIRPDGTWRFSGNGTNFIDWNGTTMQVSGVINVIGGNAALTNLSNATVGWAGSPIVGGAANNIVGQGALATVNQANWNTQISARPDDRVYNNLLDITGWQNGGTMPPSGWSRNGTAAENAWLHDTGPFGHAANLWYSGTDGLGAPNEADGGLHSPVVTIDAYKTYRFVIYFKRGQGTDGNVYLGVHGGNVRTLAGALDSNPYLVPVTFSTSGMTVGRWYALVGYVYPTNSGISTSDGGIYDVLTGQRVFAGTSFKFDSATTTIALRAFQFYCTVSTTWGVFANPRLEVIDGSEPSLTALVHLRRFHDTTVTGESGLYMTGTEMGYWNNSTGWRTYMNASGQFFYRGNSGAVLQWTGVRLEGLNSSSQLQWHTDSTTGAISAGGGNVWLDVTGVHLVTNVLYNIASSLKFELSGSVTGELFAISGASLWKGIALRGINDAGVLGSTNAAGTVSARVYVLGHISGSEAIHAYIGVNPKLSVYPTYVGVADKLISSGGVEVGAAYIAAGTGHLRATKYASGLLSFSAYQVLSYAMTTSGVVPFMATLRNLSGRADNWAQAWFVAAPNNSSNYWSIYLRRLSDASVIGVFDTSAGAADTWTHRVETLNYDVTTTHKALYVEVTKTGSPGALSLGSPAVYVE